MERPQRLASFSSTSIEKVIFLAGFVVKFLLNIEKSLKLKWTSEVLRFSKMSMTPMSPGGPPGGPRPQYGPPQPRFQGPPVGAVPVGSIGVRPPYSGPPQGPPGSGPVMSGPGSSPQGMPRPQMVNLPHRQSQGKNLYKCCTYFLWSRMCFVEDC